MGKGLTDEHPRAQNYPPNNGVHNCPEGRMERTKKIGQVINCASARRVRTYCLWPRSCERQLFRELDQVEIGAKSELSIAGRGTSPQCRSFQDGSAFRSFEERLLAVCTNLHGRGDGISALPQSRSQVQTTQTSTTQAQSQVKVCERMLPLSCHSPRSRRHSTGCARPGAKTKDRKPPNLFETGGCSASACVPGPDESSRFDTS